MFEYIRTHKRVMQGLLLLLIFPAFALFGVDSFLNSRTADTTVATVGGQAISQQEFDQALRTQVDRMKQVYGQEFDAQLLNTPETKQGILDDLIARKALIVESAKSNLAVTDEVLQKNILETPGLTKADGGFDAERYKSLLAMQNMTPTMYEQSLRQNMVVEKLVNAVQNSGFVPKAVSERISQIYEQEREVQLLSFKAVDYASQVKITDAMLRAYYDKNVSEFTIPEVVKAEYVVLNNDALQQQVTVLDTEVKALYEKNKESYTTKEERRASHILLNLKKDASESESKAVKAKAEVLLAQLRKNPESFAKLAKENSQDDGSSQNGGLLDFVNKDPLNSPINVALFKLKEGEISGLVQSEFGIHIIQLSAIKPTSIKAFEEMSGQLTAEIKKQKLAKVYADTAEVFTTTVYDQSDSLQPVADKLKLKIETVAALGRQPVPNLPATIPVNNPKFLKAIFSDESLKKKHNTEATEIAPNTLVAGRVVDYKPASKRPFEEVKATIQARVTLTESLVLAKKAGEDKIKTLQKADSAEGFSGVRIISRLKKQELPNEALIALMKADVQKLPAYIGVDVAAGGYDVYRISKVTAGTPDLARRQGESQQVANMIAQQEVFAYVEALKKKAKVVVNSTALSSKAATPVE